MSSPVLTAAPTDLLADAAGRMRAEQVSSIVVVDDEQLPVGILTENDLVRLAAAGAEALESGATHVAEWMTEAPHTVSPEVSVVEAWRTLSEKGYRHLPVVDGGRLAGIVTLRDLVRDAQIQPMAHPSQAELPKGLEGVVVAETAVGHVRGLEGFYHYRQYNAIELCEKRSLEDVWYLLFNGELPTADQRCRFVDELRPLSVIPDDVRPLLASIAKSGSNPGPLDGLRTAVSAVGQALNLRPSMDLDPASLKADALRICAVVPTLIMALYRLRAGLEPIEPDPDQGYSANYLYMSNGEVPDPKYARAVEQYQISTID
ncbi:MAG: citrate/2-methylcitrate synthase, partial [Acidimicrobiales bacterium]